jgi:hypothetical protein
LSRASATSTARPAYGRGVNADTPLGVGFTTATTATSSKAVKRGFPSIVAIVGAARTPVAAIADHNGFIASSYGGRFLNHAACTATATIGTTATAATDNQNFYFAAGRDCKRAASSERMDRVATGVCDGATSSGHAQRYRIDLFDGSLGYAIDFGDVGLGYAVYFSDTHR